MCYNEAVCQRQDHINENSREIEAPEEGNLNKLQNLGTKENLNMRPVVNVGASNVYFPVLFCIMNMHHVANEKELTYWLCRPNLIHSHNGKAGSGFDFENKIIGGGYPTARNYNTCCTW